MDQRLRPLMPHWITVLHSIGVDAYGQQVYEDVPTTYQCLFDDAVQIARTNEGELVTVGRTAYVDTAGTPIGYKDKIGFLDGSTRPLVNISTYYDISGAIDSVMLRFE